MASNVPQSGQQPPPPPNWGAPPPPTWNAVPEAGSARYGGFWLRFVAYVIDAIMVNVVAGIIGAILGFGFAAAAGGSEDPTAQAVAGAIGFVLGLAYFAGMESSSSQATLGKMAVGLKVIKSDGSRLTFARALGRYFAKILSALILFIGFIMAGFTDRKRALHDMIADTLVIKAR